MKLVVVNMYASEVPLNVENCPETRDYDSQSKKDVPGVSSYVEYCCDVRICSCVSSGYFLLPKTLGYRIQMMQLCDELREYQFQLVLVFAYMIRRMIITWQSRFSRPSVGVQPLTYRM